MPSRNFTAAGSEAYRYGFNGKENDNDVKSPGSGHQQDYGMRIYDPRIGRFLSVDPLTAKYPFYTPYLFAGNKPIQFIDIDGLEEGFNVRFEQMQRGYLKGVVKKEELIEFHKANAFAAAMGVGVLLTGGSILRYTPQVIAFASNPLNTQTLVGVGGLAASIIDPNPVSDYPGGFDDILKGGKLLLGKSYVIEKYANKINDSFHMFKDGFGLGVPKVLSPGNQIMNALYQTVDNGNKIAFDLTDVSLTSVNKGFKNFEAARDAGKITEWELKL